ncbi:hypothetical protein C672_3076 [[Clostridium] bifermentans ATCC 638]|uniref:Uncharacterized protein n=1 Tax=Paraclostridium bifermentans ATCC 638 = DSM 14991 TaxID=1233171 RepID=T4VJN9_PARBF|nr:hypothetical protein C672_3076 [[Clostridium] bifermentans ATCC 638] [Paraclostridium bifermentans ATCC 638 = DSM 14991]
MYLTLYTTPNTIVSVKAKNKKLDINDLISVIFLFISSLQL